MKTRSANATTCRLAGMNLAQRGVETDLVDCMVPLPGQLFYSTQFPVGLWFLAKTKPPTPNARTYLNSVLLHK